MEVQTDLAVATVHVVSNPFPLDSWERMGLLPLTRLWTLWGKQNWRLNLLQNVCKSKSRLFVCS
jgi:hypothetical protein